MKGFIVSIVLVLLVGCGAVREVLVPVERVRVEYRDRLTVDSVVLRDSVWGERKGDTVFLNAYRDRYRYRLHRDTVRMVDTVTVVKRVEVPVITNRLNGFQRWSVWGFWLVVLGVVCWLLIGRRF